MVRFGLAAAFAAAAAVFAAFCATAAPAEDLDAAYSIRLIGIGIGSGSVRAGFNGNTYSIEAQGKLTGLATLVSNAHGAATGKGAVLGSHISPSSYATTAVNATITRTIRMALSNNAVSGVDISPPFDARPDRIPLGPGDQRNILDPVGAFVVPGNSTEADASVCNRTLPIFDGWTRFDITMTFSGLRDVSTKGFTGKAAACAVRYTPISGHRRDRPATQYMADNRDLEVWLAPVGNTKLFMPIHISAQTMIGTVEIDATRFATH